ncbi:MAG: hypothetical protein V4754_08855 [Pseudomonadota bacterium]
MKRLDLAGLPLRLHLFFLRRGAAACLGAALCALGVAGWASVLLHRGAPAPQAAPRPIAPAAPTALVLAAPKPASTPAQNLALFYDVLGEQRYAEQQVGTLFALAAKAGLSLSRGEYKAAYDQAGRVHTYQVLLPVKGPYQSIWQFSLQALRAVPFASLDEINFKRDAINDTALEARLRLTFYLKAAEREAAP